MSGRNAKTIEIDLEIYKLIESERVSFEERETDILRRLLKLEKREANEQAEGMLNIGSGVALPNGTLLKCRHKGNEYEAPVKDGKIWVHGKGYTSPSGAAVALTDTSVNGWRFWKVKRPEDAEWISSLHLLRK